jgi:hypothetical protein
MFITLTPGPTAFTVDFGDDGSEETAEKKRLSLRDGIRRFVPKKIREKVTPGVTSPVPAAKVSPLPNSNEYAVDRKSAEPKFSGKPRGVVVDCENNIQTDDVARDDRDAKGGDAASEAGTYTIDQVIFYAQVSIISFHVHFCYKRFRAMYVNFNKF